MFPSKLSIVSACVFTLCLAAFAHAQTTPKDIYAQIASFNLTTGARLEGEVIKVDRATITLTGMVYFAPPVDGLHTAAVFIGTGKFSAPVPDSSFEKANVRRLLKTDIVESNFTSARFRMSDGSFDSIAANAQAMAVPPEAQKRANGYEAWIRETTGANISGRLAVSILNKERPGIFVSSFDGGKMGEFSFVFDPQTRIPTSTFDLNGGEKGVIFADRDSLRWSETLMAFYDLADYQRRSVQYSDTNDLVDITSYDIEADLRAPKSKLGLRTGIKMTVLGDNVVAVPFSLGEGLGRSQNERLKKQLRVRSVKFSGAEIAFAQEEWEDGFTIFFPTPLKRNTPVQIEIEMAGDFMTQPELQSTDDFSYPRSFTGWYPSHGYLDRSFYDLKFTHSKKLKVVCVGERVSETVSPEDPEVMITRYKMDQPIGFAMFALGPFVRHAQTLKWDGTEETLPLEFNSIGDRPVSEDFILAELSNSVRYFHKIFGRYPYKTYSASFHPYSFGQGFPSMLMIPPADRANKSTYSFIAHETSHQWWGNIVAWRSYRDQWLSEGFAEYSGVLYVGLRDSQKAAENLIDNMRAELRQPPETLGGQGKGRLNDVGPIVLGHRLTSSKTFGGYEALVYTKGALVLRMLHYLFTDPASGNGEPFYEMMRDFVRRYQNNAASTDDFRMVANEHFAKTPIAKRFGIKDLNWFFQQWVYETHLPTYKLESVVEPQPDGSFAFTGNVLQENVPDNFFMPLPVALRFGDGTAFVTVAALGPKTPFKFKLPKKPTKIEFDPTSWVLSEKTEMK